MNTVVQKFGGTSVDSLIDRRATDLVDIANMERERGSQTLVVLSAFSGVTTELMQVIGRIQTLLEKGSANALSCIEEIQTVQQIFHSRLSRMGIEEEAREDLLEEVDTLVESRISRVFNALDLLSRGTENFREQANQLIKASLIDLGESVSIRAAQRVASEKNIPSRYIDLHDSNAHTLDELIAEVRTRLQDADPDELIFFPGFPIRKWGWGYSDPTAAAVAVASEASVLEIWKETEGIQSGDPGKIRSGTQFVLRLKYKEARELCLRGKMQAINSFAIVIVEGANIPVRVRNTSQPDHPGTLIDSEGDGQTGIVKCVQIREEVPVFTATSSEMGETCGYAEQVFDIIAKNGGNVLCIGDEMSSLTVAVDMGEDNEVTPEELLERLHAGLSGNGARLARRALITCVGEESATTRNTGNALLSLADVGIQKAVSSHSESGTSVAFILDVDKGDQAVNALHDALIVRK